MTDAPEQVGSRGDTLCRIMQIMNDPIVMIEKFHARRNRRYTMQQCRSPVAELNSYGVIRIGIQRGNLLCHAIDQRVGVRIDCRADSLQGVMLRSD